MNKNLNVLDVINRDDEANDLIHSVYFVLYGFIILQNDTLSINHIKAFICVNFHSSFIHDNKVLWLLLEIVFIDETYHIAPTAH